MPVPAVGPGQDPDYDPGDDPIKWTIHYSYRLRSASADARIPIEDVEGPIMLVAGGDDQLWPSARMAEDLMHRREAAGGHPGDQMIIYPEAGHLIGKSYLPSGSTRIGRGSMETGGSPSGNARAQADAWPRVLAFLRMAWD